MGPSIKMKDISIAMASFIFVWNIFWHIFGLLQRLKSMILIHEKTDKFLSPFIASRPAFSQL